jgi:hypothetical protein
MSMQRDIVVGVSTFSPEDQRRQLEESIAYWQDAGPKAIWDATREITDEWFLLRGIDPTTQRVDKTVCGILPVPWVRITRSVPARRTKICRTDSDMPYFWPHFLGTGAN